MPLGRVVIVSGTIHHRAGSALVTKRVANDRLDSLNPFVKQTSGPPLPVFFCWPERFAKGSSYRSLFLPFPPHFHLFCFNLFSVFVRLKEPFQGTENRAETSDSFFLFFFHADEGRFLLGVSFRLLLVFLLLLRFAW